MSGQKDFNYQQEMGRLRDHFDFDFVGIGTCPIGGVPVRAEMGIHYGKSK